jgi:hypothetical protein
MTPRLNTGKGVTGAVRYVLGEGRDPKTGELKDLPENGKSRVDWISGTGFGWKVETAADADLARRTMEFDALNQKGGCRQDCVHLTLSWARGQQPTREEMEEAARDSLSVLGMSNAKALFVAHNDEDYAHLHIVASRLNPDTGYRYDPQSELAHAFDLGRALRARAWRHHHHPARNRQRIARGDCIA